MGLLNRYSVHLAPSSNLDPSLVSRFRKLRLKALKDDPQCFSSTYDREVRFTTDQWEARLRNDSAHTFAVVYSDHDPVSPFLEIGYSYLSANDWIGTVALVETTPAEPLSKSRLLHECVVFGIGGMYVHSEHRRRGIGAMLLEACEEQAGRLSSQYGFSRYFIGLDVQRNNRDAIVLYGKCGYRPRLNDLDAADLVRRLESGASLDGLDLDGTIILEKAGVLKRNSVAVELGERL
ncbi:hypothetical protein CC80DRAFT_494622 [Byssothecium circinans]|uniref:N-acetyltransferase domain-containing protein n=1 Tax=Byssothecium circinans TaxID=147558 RepID=A0A6A5TKY1_9PLEO|nr:hypothetical protein CC80DRAFT_494622 [Byssothecium circinans]